MADRVTSSAKNIAKSVAKVVRPDENFSWQQIQSIEKRRRAILQNSEEPFYRTLMHWDGTVLPVLISDPLMWITMLIYVGIRVWARFSLPEIFSVIGGADIGVIGVFLSFFLVFFVVTSNKRFDFLYLMSMGCKGRILDVAQLSKASLPRENAIRLVRYLNAAHIAGYVGLSDVYATSNFYEPLNQKNRFLTDKEYKRIAQIDMAKGGSCLREIISWCMREIQTAQNEGHIDGRLACMYRELVLELQRSFSAMYNLADQPISFFYVHFICLLSALYLPLFAISFALDAGTGDDVHYVSDVVTGLIVFLQAVFVIGLRVLGEKMADPYGSDLIDLSVMHYVNFTWVMSNRILAAHHTESLDPKLEEKIWHERATIGEAWDNKEEDDEAMSRLGMESVVASSQKGFVDAPNADGRGSPSGVCVVQ